MEDYSFINVTQEKLETIEILKAERDAVAVLSELKGIANLIPNKQQKKYVALKLLWIRQSKR